MPELAEKPYEDESVDWVELDVDERLARAGGDERLAIRELVIELARSRATTSLGYLRGAQPARKGT